MPFIDQLNQLTTAKAKLAQQEQALIRDRELALAKLPDSFGYADINSFIKALKDAANGTPRKGKKASKAGKAPKAEKASKRPRAKITPALKQKVIAAVQKGKSAGEIAKSFGLSVPSVHNIKKEAGLVKARAIAAAPVAAVTTPITE